MQVKYAVWFKNYEGYWVKWLTVAKKEVAERGLRYVKKKYALNGQAGIFQE